MEKARKARAVAAKDVPPSLESSIQRIANLLALLLVKGQSETEKVFVLTGAGYSTTEIGQLLVKKPNTVSARLSQASKESRGPRTTAKRRTGNRREA